MARYYGDFKREQPVRFYFNTYDDTGAPITIGGSPALKAYPDDSTTQISDGLTLTLDHDGDVGKHLVECSGEEADGYVAGKDYSIVLGGTPTVDGISVAGRVLGQFSIENRFGADTIAKVDGMLIESATPGVYAYREEVFENYAGGGGGGLDAAGVRSAIGMASANLDTQLSGISSKTTNLPSDPADASVIAGLIGAVEAKVDTVDTVVDGIKAKTDNLPSDPADQSLIIAATDAIVSAVGTVDTVVDAIKVVTDKLDTTVEADSAVYRFTTNALEQAPTGGGGGDVAAIKAVTDKVDTMLEGAGPYNLTAAALAETPVGEGGGLDAAGIRNAVGLASANLDTQLGTIDTVADGIKAKTDNLPSDPADQSLIIAATDGILTAVGTVDTVVDAIKVKTDALPSDPADQSVLAGLINDVKTKTDQLNFTSTRVHADSKAIAGVVMTGAGTEGDPIVPA